MCSHANSRQPIVAVDRENMGQKCCRYQISADDVGTDISVEAQPADVDDGHHGTVIGEADWCCCGKLMGRDSREVYAECPSPASTGNAILDHCVVLRGLVDGVCFRQFLRTFVQFRLVMSEVKTFHLMALTRTARDLIALTIRAVIPITDARLDACIVLETLAKHSYSMSDETSWMSRDDGTGACCVLRLKLENVSAKRCNAKAAASEWRMTCDDFTGVSGVMTGQEPKAVQQLVSDLKMMAAYDAAADWGEAKAMDGAYAAMSWDDAAVKAALPEYLKSSGEERAKVDYAFGALILRPPQTSDVRQAAMQTWIKARLFTYNKVLPFDFSPPAA
ncbi:hypothetical protein AK812_SmicGene20622 [Symbiodinium microadriaticum]|uniref:ATPTG10-like domain-containing protein n=1 Tax=Symbiodinium microadriaticum TaxID=2951 RepID=A0A1Q9DPK1_SYMMI|nr:hypothetical protein AK812_SmicGene20622 [Symbiodinium microadriaticum]